QKRRTRFCFCAGCSIPLTPISHRGCCAWSAVVMWKKPPRNHHQHTPTKKVSHRGRVPTPHVYSTLVAAHLDFLSAIVWRAAWRLYWKPGSPNVHATDGKTSRMSCLWTRPLTRQRPTLLEVSSPTTVPMRSSCCI